MFAELLVGAFQYELWGLAGACDGELADQLAADCASHGLPDLEFWQYRGPGERTLADCWRDAPGMNAYRGEDWMPEPCRSCPEKSRDFGGCRCQAFQLTGDASATDPACALAPAHAIVARARASAALDAPALQYRGPSTSATPR